MSRAALGGTIVAAVLVAAAIAYRFESEPIPVVDGRDALVSGRAAAAIRVPADSVGSSPRSEQRRDLSPPPSQAGVDVDGDVRLDARGHAVPTRELRRLFDFFLTATGEIAAPAITARLRLYVERRSLPPAAVGEVMDLFQRYVRYKAAFADQIAIDRGDPDALRQSLRARAELRRVMLGVAVADAFFHDDDIVEQYTVFHDDDIVEQYTVERLAIARDRSLSPEERERRLWLLRQTLPADMAAREEERLRMARLSREIAARQAAGADAETIRELRVERFGESAAARLEDLDRAREQWHRRVADFETARAAILAQPDLTVEQRRTAIDDLTRARFSANEALRLPAIDRIERARQKK